MDFRLFISDWLDPLGVVIGLALAVPIFWTWYEVVLGSRRRHRRWLREARRHPGTRPALLVVDLLPGRDVHAQVARHVRGDPALAAIPADRQFHVRRDTRLTVDDLPGLAHELRRVARDIGLAGCDTVHCFYAGPSMAAALIGAEFANGMRCLFYQNQEGRYENWGPVRHVLD